MKRSLIWRFVLIAVVILAWTYSLFPLKDRDLLPAFEEMAQSQVADYGKQLQELEAELESVAAELEAVEDKTGSRFLELEAERDAKQSEVERVRRYVENYDRLMSEASRLLDENPQMPQFLALKQASTGDETTPPIQLSDYVPVPTQADAPNNQVLSYVRRRCVGKLRLGLDLRGGTEFVIGFNPDDVPKDEPRGVTGVRDQIIEILRNRVDRLGVVEPEIKPVGPASLSLRMPSVNEDDKDEIRKTLKQQAKLEFHLVKEDSDQQVQLYRNNPEAFEPDPEYMYREMETERDGRIFTSGLFIKRRPEHIRGADLVRANASFDEFGSYMVLLQFNAAGAKAFQEVTSENVNRRLAIVLDDKVYSAPSINEPIAGGRAQITGSFSAREANSLSVVLECGKLPVSINIDSEFGTDPTLGRASIRSGFLAALWGLALVVVFMCVYYRFAGVVAVSALTTNVLLVFGTLTLSGATITLPGIAGIVLTIGMAVDANVLIFERIREELRNGKSLANAIKAGYSRAFVTILDSNLTTLITAYILARVGSGPIRGFAVTLSIGIIASMFTALYMTRAIFDLCVHNTYLKKLSMLSFFEKPNIDFLRLKRVAVVVSAALVVISLLTLIVRGRDALSIDFTGGTAITYEEANGQTVPVNAIRAILEEQGFASPRVGYKYSATDEGRLLEIVLPEQSTDDAQLDLDNVTEALNQISVDGGTPLQFTQVQTNSVGGLVGGQFQRKAVMSALLATVAIILYISFRFELAYGVAAVIALLHDVCIAAGIYLLFGRQLSLTVVAALLTIMGYSLNDTIVVFDRIREDLATQVAKSYRQIVNISINETLSRTILTSLTTLIVVITLFLFGGGAINDFALVMLIGVIVGTYSSVFVASAIISTWHKRVKGVNQE